MVDKLTKKSENTVKALLGQTGKEDNELLNQQDNVITNELSNKITNKYVNNLTDKQNISHTDPLVKLLAIKLENYLTSDNHRENKMSVGARVSKELWDLTGLYCKFSDIPIQEWLQNAIIEKLKKDLN